MKAGPKAVLTAAPLDVRGLGDPGWRRVDRFARRYLRVPAGTGASSPVRLRPWQLQLIRRLLPARGMRPRQAVVSIARANGKTLLAAILALYALLADGVIAPEVVIVASDERQARRLLSICARMVELSPHLAERVLMYQDRLTVPSTGGVLVALPADPGALQGWAPTFAVVDELHVVRAETWEAVATAAGKHPRSMALAISTPANSPDSVMWQLVEYGREHPEDPGFVLVEYAAPFGCDVLDELAWKIANPALGDFLHIDAMRTLARTTREPVFRQLRLGQWVGQAEGWLPWGAWQACCRPGRPDPGERVVLAFDGSASGDSTALVGCTLAGHVFVVDVWANPGDLRWRVPRHEVDVAVDAAFQYWDVVELACDPWGWRSEIESWSARHGATKVLEWNTANAARMGPATDRVFAAVQSQALSHDGDPRLAEHIGHCVAKATAHGDLITKDRRNSPRKIDAAVAAIVAYDRAAWHSRNAKPRRKVAAW